jgi:hypothetical protein
MFVYKLATKTKTKLKLYKEMIFLALLCGRTKSGSGNVSERASLAQSQAATRQAGYIARSNAILCQ